VLKQPDDDRPLVALALGVISTSSWAKAAAARNGERLATAAASAAPWLTVQ
jgi:hypothetical protein